MRSGERRYNSPTHHMPVGMYTVVLSLLQKKGNEEGTHTETYRKKIFKKTAIQGAVLSKGKSLWDWHYTVISPLSAPRTIPTSQHNVPLLVKWDIGFITGPQFTIPLGH